MDRWNGKIAVVTGASSGIGASIVKDLANHGIKVIGLARRVEKVEQIRSEISKSNQANLFPMKCDVSNETEVIQTFDNIIKKFGIINILINNAGILKMGNLLEMDTQLVRDTINTNIMGIIYCTREAFKVMKKPNIDGHIILINSIAGHKVPQLVGELKSINIYPPTKYSVTAIAETYRNELSSLGSKIKVTSLSPGLVVTEIVPEEYVKMDDIPKLYPEDISNAVQFVLSTKPHVQISELTIQPVGEKF